ncbi:MAG: hypothetical protein AB2603_17300 [Candidatus Thiodiazotropha endolucinida]
MRIFLKILSTIFGGFINNKEKKTEISPKENITRYIFNKKKGYSEVKECVKHGAYMPAPDGNASVYRTSEITEQGIWDLGVEYVEKKRKDGKKIKARADIIAAEIYEQELSIVPDTTPHELHANISNWPEEKDKKLMKAVELANAAQLRIKKEQ